MVQVQHEHSKHHLPNEIRWEKVTGKGHLFTPRTGHTMCTDGKLIYLFGGADLEQRTSELYSFHPETSMWKLLVQTEESERHAPAARSGSHCVHYGGSLYLFGGYTRKGGTYFNDLSQYSIVQNAWVPMQSNKGQPPTPRTDHSFVIYQSNLYVYGGRDETHIFADVFKFALQDSEWSDLQCQTLKPEECHPSIKKTYAEDYDMLSKLKLRFGHTACIYKHFMFVFGGWDGHQTLNDFAVLDLESKIWLKPNHVQGNVEGRYRHSASATKTALYIFGGINQVQKRFNDVHEFTFEKQVWTRRIALDSFEPSTRTFHQSIIFGQENWLYVFGGFDGQKTNDVFRASVSDQVVLDPNEESKDQETSQSEPPSNQKEYHMPLEEYFQQQEPLIWVKKVTQGNVFTPRTGHECILAENSIYLFGGTDDEERLNDLYEYCIRSNTWKKIQINQALSETPEPRSGARGVAYCDGLYFFGGYQRKQGRYFNDLFYYDIDQKTWQTIYQTDALQQIQHSLDNQIPSPRTDHTAVLYEGSMYIFGGYDGRARFNDLYKFKMRQKKYKWKRIQAEGTVPLNRFGHSAVVCNNCMFVIGGWNGHDTMDDVYQYSFLSNLWFEVRRIKGVRPKPRYRHSAVEYKKSIIIFGGVDTNQQRFNDLYQFNIEQRSWQAHTVTGHIPQSRTFHKSILIRNVMYIVGGFDGSRLNDLYHIALEKYEDSGRLSVRSDSDESVASHMRRGPPTSAASGIMQTVPSDLSVDQISQSDFLDTNTNNPNEYLDPLNRVAARNNDKWGDNRFLRKKIKVLQQQVIELTRMMQQEEASFDDCNICYQREINSVFLDCGHRAMCYQCATMTVLNKGKEVYAKCPICREPVKKIVKTYNI